MKLVCAKEELSTGLQSVLRSVGTRAGIPALSGVLIELTDTDLTLTTTDLELTTRVRLALTGEAGKVLVPARLLSDIVRKLSSDEVEFVTDNGTVRVVGRRARYEIRSLPPEDFPQIEAPSDTRSLTMDASVLGRAFAQVTTAASRDETRPVLTGVLLEGAGDELRIVATDSYRLAVRTLPAPGVGDLKVLVPARAAAEVARLAPSEEIRIEVSSSLIGFHVGDASIQSRLIEGEFPSYSQLLPAEQPNALRIVKEAFVESLNRMAVMAQDSTPVFLELSSDRIGISCHAQSVGESYEDVDGAYTGEELRVAFNPGYLETGLGAIDSEEVVISFDDAQRPALVHAPDDRDFLYLLMPIRVS